MKGENINVEGFFPEFILKMLIFYFLSSLHETKKDHKKKLSKLVESFSLMEGLTPSKPAARNMEISPELDSSFKRIQVKLFCFERKCPETICPATQVCEWSGAD